MSKEVAKTGGLPALSPEERADKAYECYTLYTKGKNYTEISRQTNLTTQAVKRLIKEHAVTIEKYRPETRTVAESTYRNLMDHFWKILEMDLEGVPMSPLKVAKAMEGLIQVQTRLDKFYGHESPQLHVHGDMKTAADLIRDAQSAGHNVDQEELMDYAEEEFVDMEEEE